MLNSSVITGILPLSYFILPKALKGGIIITVLKLKPERLKKAILKYGHNIQATSPKLNVSGIEE